MAFFSNARRVQGYEREALIGKVWRFKISKSGRR